MEAMERRQGERQQIGWLVATSFLLALLWISPYLARGVPIPFGYDVPVYLWRARALAAGIDVGGVRPGAESALAFLTSLLPWDSSTVLAASFIVGGVAVAMASAALVRAAGRSSYEWLTVALLAGAFARFLMYGYLANLWFTVLFLAAATLLVCHGSQRWGLGAMLLAAGGLVHPYFLALGSVVFLGMLLAIHLRRDDPIITPPILRALAVAGVVALIDSIFGHLQSLPAAPLTSGDVVLRRAGLSDLLPSIYRKQLKGIFATDGWWLCAEAGFALLARVPGTLGLFLGAWATVTMIAVPISLLLKMFAPQRLLFFAYFIPILAGLGVFRISRRLPRTFRALLPMSLVAFALWGAVHWWVGALPIARQAEIDVASSASAALSAVPSDTNIVLVVRERGEVATLPVRALNILLLEAPERQIGHIQTYFGAVSDVFDGRPSATAPLARTLETEALRSLGRSPARPVVLVLEPFYDAFAQIRSDPRLHDVADGVLMSRRVGRDARAVATPTPLIPGSVFLATLTLGLVVSISGWGWASLVGAGRFTTAALSPAFGIAAIVVTSVCLVRLGISPPSASLTAALLALVSGIGLLLAVWRARSG